GLPRELAVARASGRAPARFAIGMVVRTSVSGVRGRHAASGPKPPRAPIRVVLAALGACVVITAGTVAGLTVAGAGTHPGTRSAMTSARPGSVGTPRVTPSAAAGRRDPF